MKMEIKQLSVHPFQIFQITNLYRENEIHEYIQQINDFSTNLNCFNTRDIHKKIKRKDPIHSELIFSRIKALLPETYLDKKGIEWTLSGISDCIHYTHIKENQMIGLHSDTGSVFDPIKNRYSKFTLLTYLTDDFCGGETVYYVDEEKIEIKPETNKTIIFDIELFHEGKNVLKGNKYWLKTDLIYSRPPEMSGSLFN
jgi:hypothetical protein